MTLLNKFLKKSQTVPIDNFLDNVLYDDQNGYYSKKNPFGKKGDFVTAPQISTLFNEMIAVWIISLWEQFDKPKKFNIIELGPGDGKLCKTLIQIFKKFPKFYKSTNIFLYEKSKFLQKVQKKNIREKRVYWLKKSNQINKGPVIFIGNEFFDAIPIKQFEKKNNFLFEKFIEIDSKNKIKLILKKTSKANYKELKKYKNIKNAKFIEFPKKGFEELNWITKKIKELGGGILLVDYGYINLENRSTLQSIKSHKKNKLFNKIGEADITSLVNFGLLKDYFINKKFSVNDIVTQSFFLKRLGILTRAEILSKKMNFREKSDLYFRLKRLLDPKYMGELFKVIFAFKSKKNLSLGFK
ncbi:MAG: SAM-dependent methyltransferase [Candidatus Pelagibacter sp. TMED165]|nr:MAG: SAM-dependent methyltransferase [Candidatus Pelagibacter sp. TMED165]